MVRDWGRRGQPIGLTIFPAKISRRAFVGGLVAGPIAVTGTTATAADDNVVDLRFDESFGPTHTLKITELARSKGDDYTPPHERDSVTLKLRGLGPDALVELHVGENENSYDLRLSQVAFGGWTDRALSLSFARTDGGWSIAATTDVFSGLDLGPIDFAAFASGGALKGRAARTNVDAALRGIFDGHIRSNTDCLVSFDANLIWTITAGSKPLSAFDGDVQLGALEICWASDPNSPTEAQESTVLGKGTLAVPVSKVTIGEKPLVTNYAPKSAVTFTAQAPRTESNQAEIRLSAELWKASIEDETGFSTGPLMLGGDISRYIEIDPDKGPKIVTRVDAAIAQPGRLRSRIGTLDVAPPESSDEAEAAEKAGAPRPFTLVARSTDSATACVEQINVTVLLAAASPALAGASKNSLSFDSAALRLIYALQPVDLPASYIWLGSASNSPKGLTARLDLTRATLVATRTHDLTSLTFRFADLALAFKGASAWIAALPEECRVITRSTPEAYADNRPVLVVEFPPQHVLEEALFRQDLPPPPERRLDPELTSFELSWPRGEQWELPTDPKVLVARLVGFTEKQRTLIRRAWLRDTAPKLDSNSDRDGSLQRADDAFVAFARDFNAAAGALPPDQQIYIGPYGLDPDGMAVVRSVQTDRLKSQGPALIAATLEEVRKQYGLIQGSKKPPKKNPSDAEPPPWNPANFDEALLVEQQLEQAVPSYQLFRSYYRDQLIADAFKQDPQNPVVPPRAELEFFNPTMRTKLMPILSAELGQVDATALLQGHQDDLSQRYAFALRGQDEIPDSVNGRLATPSRLAFRIDCGTTDDHFGELEEPGTDVIAFSLDALTDWSRHELAVVRRSQRLFDPQPSGLTAKTGRRQASLDDADMLVFQGLEPGRFETALQRLAAVEATLREPPGPLETSIDLPARVIMSTAQDAQFQTPRYFPETVAAPSWLKNAPANGQIFNWRKYGDRPDPRPFVEKAVRASGDALSEKQRPVLWSASIDPDGDDPGLRVVHSPDFRPEFFWAEQQRRASDLFFPKEQRLRLPGNGAPPRGPYPPWLIGREETSNPTPTAAQIFDSYKNHTQEDPDLTTQAPDKPDSELCTPDTLKAGTFNRRRLPSLIEYLCGRQGLRADIMAAIARSGKTTTNPLFRSSLDAYDRHELVLLSSAYGLPVLGRRDLQYALVAGSDQFEPRADFTLMDVRPGSAIYRPKALNLRELTLTALGGTLRHDTSFNPPASAQYLDGGNLFDALSIERWQHWTVLGRDIFTEVVYKGFLFPLGHRASLVKVTERTFLKSPTLGIRAFLKQRLFIRVGKPEKTYPALRQPSGGRQFPAAQLELLTVKTPDIVDPTVVPLPSSDASPLTSAQASGRLLLGEARGLAFWPRTALTPQADVIFDLKIEGRITRMPLIFVDNTAAHDAGALLAITQYYNSIVSPDDALDTTGEIKTISAELHKRTMRFAGQSLRYCDERKAGDGSHETDSWTLRVEGTRRPETSSALTADDFVFDPVLEGADQPPFYPAVETSRITLRQAERFSGSPATATVAQYDKHYVENGFEMVADGSGTIAKGNAAEVYLDLVYDREMSVGSHGDRTGGVFRPESNFVAISRLKGPLGGSRADDKSKFKPNKPTTPMGNPGTLVARAGDYDRGGDPLDAYKRYFNFNTKLLGLIELRKLLQYMGLANPDQDLPGLKEVKEYGVAQMAGAIATSANDVRQLVQDQVLSPLLDVITDLEKRWDELQNSANLADSRSKPTLEQVFPEVGKGLRDLHKALDVALGTTAPVAFTAALADVYEAGRGLIADLERLAANPGARVDAALRDQIDILTGQATAALRTAVTMLSGFASSFLDLLVEDMLSALFPGASAAPLVTLGDILPPIPITAAPNSLAALDDELIETGEARTLVRQILRSQNFDATIIARVKDRLSAAATTFAQDNVLDPVSKLPLVKEAADAAAALLTAWDQIAADPKAFVEKLLPPWLQREITRAGEIGDSAKALGEALRSGQIDQAAAAALDLGTLVLGPVGLGNQVDALKLKANAYAAAILGKAQSAIEAESLCTVPSSDLCGGLDALATAIDTWVTNQAGLPAKFTGQYASISTDLTQLLAAATKLSSDIRMLIRPMQSYDAAARAVLKKLQAAAATGALFDAGSPLPAALQQYGALSDKLLDDMVHLFGRVLKDTSDLRDALNRLALDLARSQNEQVAANTSNWLTRLLNVFINAGGDIGDAASKVRSLEVIVAAGILAGLNKVLAVAVRFTAFAADTQPLKDLADALPEGALKTAITEAAAVGDAPAALAKLQQGVQAIQLQPADGLQALLDKVSAAESGATWDGDTMPGWLARLANLHTLTDLPADIRSNLVGLGERFAAIALKPFVSALLGRAPTGLLGIYADLQEGRTAAAAAVDGSFLPDNFKAELKSKLTAPITHAADNDLLGSPFTGSDQLDVDQAMLTRLSALLDATPADQAGPAGDPAWQKWFFDFLKQWAASQGQPAAAPLVIAANIQNFAADLLRGDWFKLIDVSSIRDEVERYLKNLIPLRATMSYGFGGAFSENTKRATLGIFDPAKGSRLDVAVSASVELQHPDKVNFSVKGVVGPFAINLVGDLIEAVSIKFHGATFGLGANGKPKFDVDYDTFVIGDDLKYIQQLQSLFGPSDGSGFYLQPTLSPLGIEAGYGIGLPIISFGNVSFSNISLNAAVVIPFDGNDARFKASLSRRDAPFTISVAPYGGSGFFGIEANAEGLVGFEASFEFGGAAAFQYGPLKGIGRLMLGTYIRQTKVGGRRSTELSGTFFVGGSAAIWVFSFGASLYVRLMMAKGGAMEGIATFTFSFSIGIADYDYSVSVARSEKKVGADDTTDQSNDAGQEDQASIASYLRVALASGPAPVQRAPAAVDRRDAVISNKTTCQGVNWGTFSNYFDPHTTPDDATLFEAA